jgi:hypothetical protein
MTITTVDDIAAGLSAGQKINVLKNSTVPKAIGSYQSSWLGVGFPGAGGTSLIYNAGTAYTCSSATTGAIPYTNAATMNYLAQVFASSTIAGSLFIYDRLWSCSGMGFGTATYTVGTPGALPARITDDGVNCELWVEQLIAAGAASGSLTVSMINPVGGTVSAVLPAVVSAPLIGQMQPVPLPAGTTGVKSIISATNSATWTSGSWGLTICKPVASIEIPLAGIGKTLDWAALGLPVLPADACLFFIWQGGAATANQIMARLKIIDK